MTYIRHATRAKKHTVDLTPAQDRALIDKDLTAVTVLDKGAGVFTLTFIFPDATELELTNSELSNGDVFQWDIAKILITNTAQAGLSVKLIVDQQIGK